MSVRLITSGLKPTSIAPLSAVWSDVQVSGGVMEDGWRYDGNINGGVGRRADK